MKRLSFNAPDADVDGLHVRRASFREHSIFPLSAACLVANSMREMLSEHLGTTVSTRLSRPNIPDAPAWRLLCRNAMTRVVAGPAGEAALVLRDAQAARFARAIFGEAANESAGLSGIEGSVLDRAMAQLCTTLTPVCGSPLSVVANTSSVERFTTYFEILTEPPLLLRIGVAIRAEPVTPPSELFAVNDLRAVPFTAVARYGNARIRAADLMALQPGAVLTFDNGSCEQATLAIDGTEVARGVPGAARLRRVLRVEGIR